MAFFDTMDKSLLAQHSSWDNLLPNRKTVFEAANKFPLFVSCGIKVKKIFYLMAWINGPHQKKLEVSAKKLEDKTRRNFDMVQKLVTDKVKEMVGAGFGQSTVGNN